MSEIKKPKTKLDDPLKVIRMKLDRIENYAEWMESRHMNSPKKWDRDWSAYLKDGKGSLEEMCENLNYWELVELVTFELIEKIIEASEEGLLRLSRLPYLYLDLIRSHYDVVSEKGKGSFLTKLGKLTWNDVEKAMRTKEEELEKQQQGLRETIKARQLAAKIKDRDEIWEANRKREEDPYLIEEEE